MKYAIHLSTFQKSYNESVIPHAKRAGEIGYHAIEIPMMSLPKHEVEELVSVTEYYNMEILCCNGISEKTDISSLDESVRKAGIDYLKSNIDTAYSMGSKQINGVLYAPWGFFQSKAEGKAQIEKSILSLKTIADYAKEANVTLALEIINRYEGYMINTVSEGLEFINKVDRDNVRLHFDTFHAHIEEKNMYEAIKLGAEKIAHVHICENTRGIPLTGQVNWEEVVKGLKDIKYNRYVSIENFVNTNCEVGNSAMIWRQVEKSGEEAAIKGLENMKRLFGDKEFD